MDDTTVISWPVCQAESSQIVQSAWRSDRTYAQPGLMRPHWQDAATGTADESKGIPNSGLDLHNSGMALIGWNALNSWQLIVLHMSRSKERITRSQTLMNSFCSSLQAKKNFMRVLVRVCGFWKEIALNPHDVLLFGSEDQRTTHFRGFWAQIKLAPQ